MKKLCFIATKKIRAFTIIKIPNVSSCTGTKLPLHDLIRISKLKR